MQAVLHWARLHLQELVRENTECMPVYISPEKTLSPTQDGSVSSISPPYKAECGVAGRMGAATHIEHLLPDPILELKRIVGHSAKYARQRCVLRTMTRPPSA